MAATREKTLVGLFVLAAIAILFGAVLALTGGIGVSRAPFHTFLKFSGGLDTGGTVRYGGLNVGKIIRVGVDPADSTRIEIDFAVDPNTQVKTDSVARVSTMGLLSDSFLEISPGSRAAPRALAGSELPSIESIRLEELGDALVPMLPDAQKTLKSLNTDLNGLQTTIAQANDLLNEKNRATIAAALNNLNGAIAELRPEIGRTLKHADDLIVDAQPKISSTLADVQELTKKIAPMLDDLKKTIKTADDTIAHVDGTLGENREDLRASVTALRRVLDQSNALVGQLNATLNDNSDDIDESVENIRQATENLRQLTDMLRTSPASIIRGTGIKDRLPGGVKK